MIKPYSAGHNPIKFIKNFRKQQNPEEDRHLEAGIHGSETGHRKPAAIYATGSAPWWQIGHSSGGVTPSQTYPHTLHFQVFIRSKTSAP